MQTQKIATSFSQPTTLARIENDVKHRSCEASHRDILSHKSHYTNTCSQQEDIIFVGGEYVCMMN